MKSLITVLLLLLIHQTTLAQVGHVRHDSLVVVWGQKNYSGISDCSACANISSTDSTLTIEIDVTDDKLVYRKDSLHSDHVEIWFSPRAHYDSGPPYYTTSYIWDSKRNLYLFKDTANLQAFQREIRSPLINASNYESESLSYDSLDPSDESWLKDEIDKYLNDVRQSKLSLEKIFYGIVHLGFFPESGQIILYDRENYSVLEKLIGLRIPDLTRFAVFQLFTKPNGYRLKITLRPEAIGFSGRNGISQLKFMVDVIDVDNRGRQETILSTSTNRRWGDPSTFKQLDLYPPIRVHLCKDFPEAGNPRAYVYSHRFLPVNYLPLDFLYTEMGWIPVERTIDGFYAYNQPEGFSLENITKLSYKRAMLHYRSERKGKDTLEFLNSSGMGYLFIGRRFVCPTKDTLAMFLLPDSSVAILFSKFESSGTFTRTFLSSLSLAAGSIETTLAEIWNGSELIFTPSLSCKEGEWDKSRMEWDKMYDEQNFDWTKIFRWDHFGRSIVVDLGNNIRVQISWSNLGNNVKYLRL
jgi:hypothetical protein